MERRRQEDPGAARVSNNTTTLCNIQARVPETRDGLPCRRWHGLSTRTCRAEAGVRRCLLRQFHERTGRAKI